jgi:hypothetical protein
LPLLRGQGDLLPILLDNHRGIGGQFNAYGFLGPATEGFSTHSTASGAEIQPAAVINRPLPDIKQGYADLGGSGAGFFTLLGFEQAIAVDAETHAVTKLD